MADKIAAMADRFRTEIDTGDEETEAKKTNGAGDEILEYAVQYAQDGSYPLNLTKEKRRLSGSVLPFSELTTTVKGG